MHVVYRAFAILEWLAVMLVIGVVLYIGLIARHNLIQKKHRQDAIQTLISIEKSQAYFYRRYGFYGNRDQVWPQVRSPKGYYEIRVEYADFASYRIAAVARDYQKNDVVCRRILLSVSHGVVSRQPAGCWN